ncbi:vacuolar protein sorting-associated protein 55 homolog isoform X1 [Amborella trichopoda]|uniref:vacuolar protein sorting-associated protein 55 homolog isoform X1 n=1 Tax=Amborella trichopoda TaxID=13333 RepID=UPI0009C026DE|nr:vacuolar protein sorting-associated protein 55 homolog isoform X1 [Amborella trichopoda]XP_020532140.1 vacuolar protein sorting-associated protein 55 homolog isoform X1 [Amborella trichopoda]|eukprot:XP_020532139.1 vacuolar protein sorting-associated protein 55 homolog isoform X1 [Amborella trichopoda]
MGDCPGYVLSCLHSFNLAGLAVMVSAGIVLQILACALYSNWWPMLSGRIKAREKKTLPYALLPMPALFLLGSDSTSILSSETSSWVDAAKFLTGIIVVWSIAIPTILKHAGIIGWGAMFMDLSSFVIFILSAISYFRMSSEAEYGIL